MDKAGTLRGFIAAPYAVDSTPDAFTGGGRTTTALHYELGTSGGRPTVTVVIHDTAWLAKAVYPVYVDPSTTIVLPGAGSTYGDSFVNEGNTGMNYGSYQRPDSPGFYEVWLRPSPQPGDSCGQGIRRERRPSECRGECRGECRCECPPVA